MNLCLAYLHMKVQDWLHLYESNTSGWEVKNLVNYLNHVWSMIEKSPDVFKSPDVWLCVVNPRRIDVLTGELVI